MRKCKHCKEIKIDTMECPDHGVFCSLCGCKSPIDGAILFPFVICPDCGKNGLTLTEIYEKTKITGPNGEFKKLNLPTDYMLLRDDRTGYWIGKNKK